jgi:hypothetical protein
MLRKRIEKLEATLPPSPGRLLERLDRQALNSLSGNDRGLVTQMLAGSDRRKVWPAEHRGAEASYLENFGVLLREVSDDDLACLISQVENDLGRPIPEMEVSA